MPDQDEQQKLAGVLTETLDTLEHALKLHEADRQTIAQLEAKLAAQDKVILEKVAAASRPVFSAAEVNGCLTRLVNLHLVRPEAQEKIAAELQRSPDKVFAMMTTLTQALMSAPSEGAPFAKEAGGISDEDPDGWWLMARGLPVPFRH